MHDSVNDGFVVTDSAAHAYHVRFLGNECYITAAAPGNVPSALVAVMNAVVDEYSYILYHE